MTEAGVFLLVTALALATGLAAAVNDDYWEFACSSKKIMTLTCPQPEEPAAARYILVTNATYGIYSERECHDTCCDPTDDDCHVPVDSAKPGALEIIMDQCNMKESSCELEAFFDTSISGFCPDLGNGIMEIETVYFICVYDDGNPPTTLPSTTTSPPLSTSTTPPPSTSPPTTPTPPPTQPSTTSALPPGGSSNVGSIVGGVLGGLCLVAIGVLVALICIRRKQALEAQKRHSMHKLVNGRASTVSNGAVPAYINPGYEDEEMIIGNGAPRIRALSKTDSQLSSRNSQHYENVRSSQHYDTMTQRDSEVDGVGKEYEKLGAGKEGDNVSASTGAGTDYENVEMEPSGDKDKKTDADADAAKVEEVKENRSVPSKFEKKAGASSKGKAPVAKKAAPKQPSNLNKAQSAMDISMQPKLDKSSGHKKSAPCLGGTGLSTAVDTDRLKDDFAKSKPKSASTQALNRRSIAASEKSEGQPMNLETVDNEAVEKDDKVKGPEKEIF